LIEQKYLVDDIFGISRDLPLNYIERTYVDDIFLKNLVRRQHLVIYGSSKQGKTSLIKHCLDTSDYIFVYCSNKWTLNNLYEVILKQAGFELTGTNTISTSGQQKILAKLKAGVQEGEIEQESLTKAPLELDSPLDTNDIIASLNAINFTKFIVLEDFHYLPVDTQKDFAVGLKAFHEKSKLSFIIIGVWLEKNKFSEYNRDLTGRILSINADKWEIEELKKVISHGEALLNIYFTEKFKKDLLVLCYGSVYIIQETCRQCCINDNIYSTQEKYKEVGSTAICSEIIRELNIRI
jgi:hypothetical protein